MGNVMPYESTLVDPPDDVKLSDFSFKLVSVETADLKKKSFNEKYKIKLATSIRSRYIDDVIFGSDWRELLKDFDTKCFGFHWCSQKYIFQHGPTIRKTSRHALKTNVTTNLFSKSGQPLLSK